MSTTITTTTTTTYTSNDPGTFIGTLHLRGAESPETHDIEHCNHGPKGGKGEFADAVDDLALPNWLKDFVKSTMGGGEGANLPSDASAAKTINNFQKEHDIGLLSIDQVKQMADTGYCTGKDGKTFQVPEEVQLAAQKMMANNGELFKKLESATDGKHDGQLGKGDYGNAIKDGTISKDAGASGAPRERGLSMDDFMNAIMKGCIASSRPSEYGAAKTISDFQKEHDIGLLSVDQLKMMAETGYCKDKDGNRFQVPEEVQGAAQKMLEDDGALFKKLESAVTGKHDGQLSTADFREALKDGTISKDSGTETVHTPISFGGPNGPGGTQQFTFDLGGTQGAGGDGAGLPSDSSAARTISQFQKEHDIDLLSAGQMQKMAETGYCTGKDGKTFQVSEEVQNAAKQMMANDGELFKKMESAFNGKHDGLLSRTDYKSAVEDGTISRNPGTTGGDDPAVSDAAKQITDFMKKTGGSLLSLEDVQAMARGESVVRGDGPIRIKVDVPPELQEAAKKLLENNAEGFKQLESGVTGKHDGLVGTGDYDAAVEDGTFTA